MPPLPTLISKAAGYVPQVWKLSAWEKLVPSIFHPEQILRQDPAGRKLFGTVTRIAYDTRQEERPYHELAQDLMKKFGVKSDKDRGEFFTLLEFPTYAKRPPTPEELKHFSPNVRKAVVAHLEHITDPIWQTAKAGDASIGYIPGYFTHFSPSVKHVLEDESKRVAQQIADLRTSGDPAAANTIGGLESQLEQFKNRLTRVGMLAQESHIDETLAAQRFGILQKGGYSGPMNEHRKLLKGLGIERGYEEIMHDYVSNAYRKIFLDRLMPAVKPFFQKEVMVNGKKVPNPDYIQNDFLRTYAYDYIQAQRGTLGAKSKVTFNAALKELFPTKGDSQTLSRVVNEVTRFQYITKIGISARFPIVNLTQPLLTLYPLVGEKIFLQAYHDLFTPGMWKRAEQAGAIYDPYVRQSVTEFFGAPLKHEAIQTALNVATWPAMKTEKVNRVVTFAAGLRKAAELGLKGTQAERFAIKMIDDTQFRYFKEAMPLAMSRSMLGRVLMQFRTFTANYVNYISKLVRERKRDPEGNAKLIRALGALMVLSGSATFPMWDWVRGQVLRKTKVDIGKFNPIEWGTEQLGLVPGLNLGSSLEPFNFPSDIYNLLGPSLGPITKLAFGLIQQPDDAEKAGSWMARSIAPPLTSYLKTGEKEARMKTQAHPEGKVIGKRPTLEKMFLRPALESIRSKAIKHVANTMVAGRQDLTQAAIRDAQKNGVLVNGEFMSAVRQRVAKLRRR